MPASDRMNSGDAGTSGSRAPGAVPGSVVGGYDGTVGAPAVYGGDSYEFWEKLGEMKAKYCDPLSKMSSFLQIVANSQRPEKKEQFKKHIKDCFQILGLKRGQTVPAALTTTVLETTSKFLDSVINVYKYYVNEQNEERAAEASVSMAWTGN